jgi:monoamine oxidase
MFTEKGIVVSGYGQENGEFGAIPTTEARIAASRLAIDKVHPGHGKDLAKPIYVSWARTPYNEGSWVSRTGTDYYGPAYKELLAPDDRIYFAGDHCSHIVAWQEGAALSARRTVRMIADRVRKG